MNAALCIAAVALLMLTTPALAEPKCDDLVLYADGQHDDTLAFEAWLRGARLHYPDGQAVGDDLRNKTIRLELDHFEAGGEWVDLDLHYDFRRDGSASSIQGQYVWSPGKKPTRTMEGVLFLVPQGGYIMRSTVPDREGAAECIVS